MPHGHHYLNGSVQAFPDDIPSPWVLWYDPETTLTEEPEGFSVVEAAITGKAVKYQGPVRIK